MMQTQDVRDVKVEMPSRLKIMHKARLNGLSLSQMIAPLTQSGVSRLEEKVCALERRLNEVTKFTSEFFTYKRATEALACEVGALHKLGLYKRSGSRDATKVAMLTASVFGLRPDQIMSRQRPDYIAVPRMVAMYVMRTHLGMGLQEIGAVFGRDHGTAMHAIRRVDTMLKKGWSKARAYGFAPDSLPEKVAQIKSEFPKDAGDTIPHSLVGAKFVDCGPTLKGRNARKRKDARKTAIQA